MEAEFRLPPYLSHKKCCICGPTASKTGLLYLTSELRVAFLVQYYWFAPEGCRVCNVHLTDNGTISIEPQCLGGETLFILDSSRKRRAKSILVRWAPAGELSEKEFRCALALAVRAISEQKKVKSVGYLSWHSILDDIHAIQELCGARTKAQVVELMKSHAEEARMVRSSSSGSGRQPVRSSHLSRNSSTSSSTPSSSRSTAEESVSGVMSIFNALVSRTAFSCSGPVVRHWRIHCSAP